MQAFINNFLRNKEYKVGLNQDCCEERDQIPRGNKRKGENEYE